jgi:hypothetical protein
MRVYDEPIDVRRGQVSGQEAPEQFIWRDKLWLVTEIVSHWVETGAWWEQSGVAELLGIASTPADRWASSPDVAGSSREEAVGSSSSRPSQGNGPDTRPLGADLLAERDMWRVEAARGRLARFLGPHASGVFDLCFDWATGQWTLTRCLD